jgi:hypothetical protein
LKICIITPTIDDCIYEHPYFKFYNPRSETAPYAFNPIDIFLGNDDINGFKYEIQEISKGMQSIWYVLKIFCIYFDFYIEL